MGGIIIGVLAAAAAGAAYYYGNQIGRCEGFEEGMDAAIAVYEETLREETMRT